MFYKIIHMKNTLVDSRYPEKTSTAHQSALSRNRSLGIQGHLRIAMATLQHRNHRKRLRDRGGR